MYKLNQTDPSLMDGLCQRTLQPCCLQHHNVRRCRLCQGGPAQARLDTRDEHRGERRLPRGQERCLREHRRRRPLLRLSRLRKLSRYPLHLGLVSLFLFFEPFPTDGAIIKSGLEGPRASEPQEEVSPTRSRSSASCCSRSPFGRSPVLTGRPGRSIV